MAMAVLVPTRLRDLDYIRPAFERENKEHVHNRVADVIKRYLAWWVVVVGGGCRL